MANTTQRTGMTHYSLSIAMRVLDWYLEMDAVKANKAIEASVIVTRELLRQTLNPKAS